MRGLSKYFLIYLTLPIDDLYLVLYSEYSLLSYC